MALTPEQLRLKQLFEGNPLANQQLPQQAAPVEEEEEYQADTTPQMAYTTQPTPNPDAYHNAISNRFNSITDIGTQSTNRALGDAQAKAAADYAARLAKANAPQFNGSNTGAFDQKSATGAKTGNAERDFLMGIVGAQKGMPYSWGGGNSKGPSYGLSGGGERHGSSKIYGFDCSGLVQYAYAKIGIKMPRLAGQQMAMGTRIPLGKAQAGDLVGKPGHIAIYAGNGMMWEAPTFGKQVRLVPVRNGMFAVHVKGVG